MRAGWTLLTAAAAAGLVALAAAGCYEGYVDTRTETRNETGVAGVTPIEPALATFALG